MSWVSLFRRKCFLRQEISNLNRVAEVLSQKLHDLHKYSAAVARGCLTPLAMAGMPKSCMALATGFALAQGGINRAALQKAATIWGNHYGNAGTGLTAAQAGQDFGSTVGTMLENPKLYEQTLLKNFPDEAQRNQEYMKHQYMLHMFQQAQKEEQREYAKQKAEEIKVIEDEIQQEQTLNKTKLDAYVAEDKEIDQAIKSAQDRAKPVYG